MSRFYVNRIMHDAIDKRMSLQEYILECCKGFGFAYHLSEQGKIEKLTYPKVDTYHSQCLKESTNELEKWLSLDEHSRRKVWEDKYEEIRKDGIESFNTQQKEWEYAESLRKQIEEWDGIEELPQLKEHMLGNLHGLDRPTYSEPHKVEFSEWAKKYQSSLEWDVNYHQEKLSEASARQKRNCDFIDKVNPALEELVKKTKKMSIFEDGEYWDTALDILHKSTQVFFLTKKLKM